jgi:glycerophosphoryl diester phosphodiesterase
MRPGIPALFAHRGCSGSAPENTLSAFKLAAERGIPGIELDVQFAQSGEVVVIHDTNLKRLAGVDIPVASVHWSELRTVDVGSWYDKSYSSERIPLLEELFESLGSTIFYDIELKTSRRSNDRLPIAVVKIIARFGLEANCMISSFNPFAVRTTRIATRTWSRIDKDAGEQATIQPLITSVIYSRGRGVPPLFRSGGGCALARCAVAKPNWKQAGKLAIARHHLLGRPVSAWTVNDEATARRLFDSGVDAIISDVPEKLIHLVPER